MTTFRAILALALFAGLLFVTDHAAADHVWINPAHHAVVAP